MDFGDINYLRNGSKVQRRALEVLTKFEIISQLVSYKPILAGTIPIGIDIEGSDLDILCQYWDKYVFIDEMRDRFGHHADFEASEQPAWNAVIINFTIEEFPVEIYAQDIPAREQRGYRHMIIEHRILVEKGESFRQQIIELKKKGIKTEPAFAKLLQLGGDPYEALLELE